MKKFLFHSILITFALCSSVHILPMKRKLSTEDSALKTVERSNAEDSALTTAERSSDEDSALIAAVRGNDLDKVKELLDRGSNIHNSFMGKPILTLAVEANKLEIVKELLTRYKIYLNNTNLHFNIVSQYLAVFKYLIKYCLGIAIKNDHIDLVIELLKKGIYEETTISECLCYAAELGKLSIVQFFLSKGADVDTKGNLGCTPIMEASANGHVDVVKLLIMHNAKLDIVNRCNETALMVAIKNCQFKVVEELAKNVNDINSLSEALMYAARCGNIDFVLYLLSREADINYAKKSFERISDDLFLLMLPKLVDTPLNLAIDFGHLNLADILLKKGAIPNLKTLVSSIKLGDLDLLNEIVDKVAYRPKELGSALIYAVTTNKSNIVEYLLNKGAKLDSRSMTRLITIASENGYITIVRLLIEANLTLDIDEALRGAISNGHRDVVELLIDHGAILNNEGRFSGLILAAQRGHVNILSYLLQRDRYDKNMLSSALLAAISWEHLGVVKFLLDKHPEINVGWVILIAIRNYIKNNGEIFNELVSRGADINATDQFGRSLLMLAIKKGIFNGVVAKQLLDLGADVNIVDNDGKTALMLAIFYDEMEIAKEILRKKPTIIVPNVMPNICSGKSKSIRTDLGEEYYNEKVYQALVSLKDFQSGNISPEDALNAAVLNNNILMVKYLLVNYRLSVTCLNQQCESVKKAYFDKDVKKNELDKKCYRMIGRFLLSQIGISGNLSKHGDLNSESLPYLPREMLNEITSQVDATFK